MTADRLVFGDHPSQLAWGIGDIARKRAQLTPDATAFVFEDVPVTYHTLNVRVNQVAHALKKSGLKKGDRVATLLFNGPAFIETYFAAAKLGAIFVPLNFRLVAPEIQYQLNNSGACLFIFDEQMTAEVAKIRNATSIRPGGFVVVTETPDLSEGYPQWVSPFESWIKAEPSTEPHPDAPVSLMDPLAIIHTSGVTGNPKGAVVSHLQTYFKCMQVVMYTDMRSDDIFLAQIPLFHSAGLSVVLTPVLFRGAAFLLRKHFDPSVFARDIEKYKPTIILALTTMWRFVLETGELDRMDLSCVRQVLGGGERTPASLLETLADRGIHLQQVFGQTENSAMMVLPGQDVHRKAGSVGMPGMCNDVWIADENGQAVQPGTQGRILARGPTVMSGYWGMPEKTAESLSQEGVLDTGDIGFMDEDGYFYIVDRAKDMYRSGGENVYPAEVEKVLMQHAGIVHAAVVGVNDETWGEAGKAFVVLQKGANLSLADLHRFLEGKLARYKYPRHLEVLDALPLTASGKVHKAQLKKR